MSEEQLKVLSQKLDTLQASADRIDRDLAQDREDLQSFTLKLGNLINVIEELRKSVIHLPEKTQDKVAEVTQGVIDGASELNQTIADKKKILVIPRPRRFKWLERFS